MKRRALAVAVGALFVAPAAHAQITFGNEQLGTLQIYGKLYPQVGWASSSSATQPGTTVSNLVSTTPTNFACPAASCPGTNVQPRTTVDVSNSYLGFRGERNLGAAAGGLKAIWQIETALNFDSPDASTANGTNAFWSTRNSFLGLSSRSFGTVKLGNMDTVYKEYGDTFSMFGISSGNFVSASNVLSHIGVGNNRSARFHERRTNSINYETPTVANFTAGVMYGPDEAKTNGLNANLYSYGVKWDTERFYASIHQEQHNDFFGGSNNVATPGLSNVGTAGAHSHDRATRFSGEWRMGGGNRLVLDIARLTYKETGQAPGAVHFQSYEHTNWGLGFETGFGPWGFATQFLQGGQGTCHLTAGAGCSTEGLRGRMLTAGVRYRFDRQTFVYAIGAALQNDKSARYDNWAADNPNRGGEIKQAALGISYTF
jgi:predicted porin